MTIFFVIMSTPVFIKLPSKSPEINFHKIKNSDDLPENKLMFQMERRLGILPYLALEMTYLPINRMRFMLQISFLFNPTLDNIPKRTSFESNDKVHPVL